MKNQNKPNIGVITMPFSSNNIVGKTVLANFIELLCPISNKIFIINGLLPKSPKKIHLIKAGRSNEEKTILISIIKFLLIGPRTSINLIKISKNVDVVIFFFGATTYSLPMLSAKLMKKKTIIVAPGSVSKSVEKIYNKKLSDCGGIIFGGIFRILEKINYTFSDRIFIYSEGLVKEWNLEKYKNKISIAHHHFLDFDKFKIKKKFDLRKNLVGYIGRLSEEKGVLNFVKAIPKIMKKRDDLEFLIGGDGPLRDEIEKYLEGENLNDKVKLSGWIPREEFLTYLNELKLFVLPSYTEGLPYTILEAMACGTPVLATPVGAIPDVIKDGETGFILENNSPECIAENVIRALEHPNLDKTVKNARELVGKEFTYEAAVEKYRKILNNPVS